MKFVVIEMLHSILRTFSVETVEGSSGASSHFNLETMHIQDEQSYNPGTPKRTLDEKLTLCA